MALGNRTAIFIDGSNTYATAKMLGMEVDYKKLLNYYGDDVIRAYYYTAIIEDEEFSTIRPLVDWLDYNGFTVVTKPTKEYVDSRGVRKVKGNMDVELVVDAMTTARYVDHIIIYSGDGDFAALVVSLKRQGLRVTVVSSIETIPPICSDELRRAADTFIDLASLKQAFIRQGEVPPRKDRSRYG